MESSARSHLLDSFLPADPSATDEILADEDGPVVEVAAAAIEPPAEPPAPPAPVEAEHEADATEVVAEAGAETPPVEDAVTQLDLLPPPSDENSDETSGEPSDGASGEEIGGEDEDADTAEEVVEAIEPVMLGMWEDGGRVWLSIPGDASLRAVGASLSGLELPGGVLWLSLGARPVTAASVGELCGLVAERVGRPVAGVRCHRGAMAVGLQRAVGVAVELEGEAPAEMEGRGRQVLVVERTLRSGAAVRFKGDVLVYGDVNAGAEIEAGGNIIVLGALRGMAWAGQGGDESAMIISFDLRPVQLRIGRQIAFLPERGRLRAPRGPEVAVVRDGQVVLQEYRGRLSG